MNTFSFSKTVALFAGVALISGAVGGGIAASLIQPNQINQNGDPSRIIEERAFVEESDTIAAIEKVAPAVLSVVATKDVEVFMNQGRDPFFNDPFFRDFFGIPEQQPQQQQPETERLRVGGGTGFIIQEDGLAITNKHVVNDPQADYSALTNEGVEYDVEVIARDPVNDLAIIQLHEKGRRDEERRTGEEREFGPKPKNMPKVELGDSTKLQVGQNVLAIGNARGEYANSVTSGIVSAIGRDIQAGDSSGQFSELLTGLIQTDAAINFGNSGGPLINLAGQVVGVNTAIDAAATGIGFAIPINQIKPALESVAKHGRIIRPVLGVRHIILNEERAAQMKLDDLEYGALITGDRSRGEFGIIPDSPAEKAGLRIDDVILEVNAEKIDENNELSMIVREHAPGDTLRLKVWRGGEILNITVTLEEFSEA
ncbi:hypothetical protein COV82_02195 [Candidatus Peregrinibacteria bacterium CG11_big_fil_rev_8_21_14_0_20_46_8]|nr:MAG: hypothetical protein COV82_02195 [Candidatus Peregrinibacteria bacterium CG11_big_fil_rev_8_21_14_0_20_46_8]